MPNFVPRIDIKMNMQGIADRLRQLIGEVAQPSDLYEVYNNAQAPNGQYYWPFVNYGTSSKHTGFTSQVAPINKAYGIKGSARGFQLSGSGRMRFAIMGRLIGPRVAGPNKPYYMRERTLPLIRQYFVKRITDLFKKLPQKHKSDYQWVGTPSSVDPYAGEYIAASGKRDYTVIVEDKPSLQDLIEWKPVMIGMKEYVGEFVTAKVPAGTSLSQASRGGLAGLIISVMEDTMDYTVDRLALFTPVIKSEYYSESFTPEPGLLRDSYGWRRITGAAGRLLVVEKAAGIFTGGHGIVPAKIGRRHTTTRHIAALRLARSRQPERTIPGEKINVTKLHKPTH